MAKITYATFEGVIINALVEQHTVRGLLSAFRRGWCENRPEYVVSTESGRLYFALVDTLSKDTADDNDRDNLAFLKHFDSDKTKRYIAKTVLERIGYKHADVQLALSDLSWER